MGTVGVLKMADMYTHKGQIYGYLVKPLLSSPWLGRNVPGYILSSTPNANSCAHISFSLPPTHFTWMHLILAGYPRNLRGFLVKKTKKNCFLITLGTRCISCHFVSSVWLPLLHWLMSKGIVNPLSKKVKKKAIKQKNFHIWNHCSRFIWKLSNIIINKK